MSAFRAVSIFVSWVASVCIFSSAHAAHQENGQVFEGPGGKLYFEVMGKSPAGKADRPLVLVNGGPGFSHDHLHTAPTWAAVAKGRQVVFYDQRGTGRSTTSGTQTLDDQVADLEAVRAKLGAEQIDLLGHSWGGFLGMVYATRYPHRVARLILVDSSAPKIGETVYLFSQVFPDLQAQTQEEQKRIMAAAAGKDKGTIAAAQKAAEKAGIVGYLKMIFYSTEKRDVYLEQLKELPDGSAPEVNAAVNADFYAKKYDFNAQIAELKMPTLVITGRYDMNVAPIGAWKIHKAIPGSQFLVFERSSHMPFYEEPDLFVRELETFLGKPR